MKTLLKLFAVPLFVGAALSAQAEIAVIVSASSNVASLSEDEISRIFLGKTSAFPGGGQAVPIAQDDSSPVRAKFNETVCKKNPSQYKAYWSQLVFTGKGTPPKDAGNDAAVKALIAANPNMIGYVDSKVVDASVKVVYKF